MGAIGIIERRAENFYPKGREGWLPISAEVMKELQRFSDLSTNDYIIPGATPTERASAVDRRQA